MVVLSFVCATVLSVLASVLAEPQEVAREFYRSKQMLVAARILNPTTGYLQVLNDKGEYVPAEVESGGKLVAGSPQKLPTQAQILEVYKARIEPFLVDAQGKRHRFEELKIDEKEYVSKNRKTGYYKLPYKLIYEIHPNPVQAGDQAKKSPAAGYVIPVNGFGLWDAIYGYLAIAPDGNQVIGISWYEQKETPGLGANIAEADWQSQFPGKQIFQPSANAQLDVQTAPLGIVVVRGKVAELYGDAPKAKSAVDGMAGATLTGNGVTAAYRDILAAYRPFLVAAYESVKK